MPGRAQGARHLHSMVDSRVIAGTGEHASFEKETAYHLMSLTGLGVVSHLCVAFNLQPGCSLAGIGLCFLVSSLALS